MTFRKPLTKLLVLGSVLVLTAALSTTLVVACSSTSNPAITTAATYNYTENGATQKITISTDAKIDVRPGISFKNKDGADSKLYNTAPAIVDFSKTTIEDQRAFSYFFLMTNFITWLQAYAYNVQNFISASPIVLPTLNPKFNKEADVTTPPENNVYNYNLKNIAAALSTTINDGRDTARLGLKEVSFNSNFQTLVNDPSYLVAYDASVALPAAPSNYIENVVSDISFQYNWWTTGGNNVSWKADNWDVDSQNLTAWKEYKRLGFDAQQPFYKLELANISFWSQSKYAEDKEKKTFYPAGFLEVRDPSNAFNFSGLTNVVTGEMSTFLVEADKRRVGDLVNQSFFNYVNERPEMVNNLLISLKR